MLFLSIEDIKGNFNKFFIKGLLITGDLGVLGENNRIFIRGRSKNMILGSSGQNIYPEEIESKLNAMPYILESLILSKENKLHALLYLDYERIKEENLNEEEIKAKLENNRILEKREELNICKKLESKYSELGKKEEAFKYAIKIIKIEPSNNLYIIKVANTLAKEGNFKLSNHYFGKAIVSKTEFMTEDLKCAAFVSYKMKDYKKCIAFLEELRKE